MARWLLCALALAGGCKQPSRAAPADGAVSVELDGAVVGSAAPGDLDATVALTSLLPPQAREPAGWRSLRAQSLGGREIHIDRFGERMGDSRVMLRRDDGGGVRVEVLGPVAEGVPHQVAAIANQPIAALDDVRRIEVMTRAVREAEAPPAPRDALELRMPGHGRVAIAPEELEALSVAGDQKKQRGAPLGALIARHQPLDGITAATLVTAAGESLTLTRADLTGPDLHLLRHNRRGDVRYHHYPAGARDPAHDLREVTRIELK
ncbi:MAG TPA: hypothetical protein VMZ28_17965 [Kofleriaceae bacterium]|nr:hypothetical protein [Kofleriaceae bacterium]